MHTASPHPLWTSRFVRTAALALTAALLTSACQSYDWRQHNLALHGEKLAFQGDKFAKGTSGGSGFWVTNDIVATNAHVAVRSLGMYGQDDDGNKYRFRQILGLDRVGDIAFIRAERATDHPGVTFIERPSDPLDLRGRKVKLLSNTGLVGTQAGSMFLYSGEVTNVIGDSGNDQVLHNANTAGGASGSAVFDADTDEVVSINWGSSPRYNSKLSTAAWRVQEEFAKAQARMGVDMKDLFTVQNAIKYFKPYLNRKICLAPKQKVVAPVNGTMVADMAMAMVMDKPSVMAGGIAGGGQLMWKGLIKNKVPILFSLSGKGMYKLILLNPTNEKICGRVLLGNVAWENGIK